MIFTRLLHAKSFECCPHCQRYLVTDALLEVEAVPPVKKEDAAADAGTTPDGDGGAASN